MTQSNKEIRMASLNRFLPKMSEARFNMIYKYFEELFGDEYKEREALVKELTQDRDAGDKMMIMNFDDLCSLHYAARLSHNSKDNDDQKRND